MKLRYRIMTRGGKYKIERETYDVRNEKFWTLFEHVSDLEEAKQKVLALRGQDEPWVEVPF